MSEIEIQGPEGVVKPEGGGEGDAPAVEGPEPAVEEAVEGGGGDQAAALRELVLKAHPDVVPELVSGESLDELLASLPAAQAAYQRITASLQRPDTVPAGGGSRSTPIDTAAMPAVVKIREGLKAR